MGRKMQNQLSACFKWCPEADSNHRHADFQSIPRGLLSLGSMLRETQDIARTNRESCEALFGEVS